jgi:hypothetical protein
LPFYHKSLAVVVCKRRDRFTLHSRFKQLVSRELRIVGRDSAGRLENAGLVFPAWMVRVKAILRKLVDFDDRVFGIG